MRILFVTWPGNSHLFPLIPLAWSFQGAGHQVMVATHHTMTPSIRSLGLIPAPIGDPARPPTGPNKPYPQSESDQFEQDAIALDLPEGTSDPWDIFTTFMAPGMWDFLPPEVDPAEPLPGVDDLIEFCLAWQPDLVVWDPCVPAAAIAARVCGAAHTRFMWWQDYFAWLVDRWDEAGLKIGENPLSRMLRGVADRWQVEIDRELLVGQWTLDLLPQGYRLETSTRALPLRFVVTPSRTELPDWLIKPPEKQRIAISLGMSQRDYTEGGWHYVPALLDAVADLDIEVAATLTPAQLEDVTTVPKNVRLADYVPLDELLPTCSVLVHQGGFGTVCAAAQFQLPQLITEAPALPVTMKYPVSKSAVDYITPRGAALIADTENPSAEQIAASLQQLLTDPAFKLGAVKLHEDWLAMPGPSDLLPTLERLTNNFRASSAG